MHLSLKQFEEIMRHPNLKGIKNSASNMWLRRELIWMKNDLGLKTILGISNISFGLPNRAIINSTFFTMALQNGLSCAIVNPLSKELMDSYYSFRSLAQLDKDCSDFIKYSTDSCDSVTQAQNSIDYSLSELIERGLLDLVSEKTHKYLELYSPLEIINNDIIPALNSVGSLFESGKIFLPQLLNSAEAATRSFDVIKEKASYEKKSENSVILATVKGDIHDIGKNIVKLLLESHGFTVHDLGKNVSPERVVEAVKIYNCKLVALSALMTTTLDAMSETIVQLKNFDPSIKIMVGGAVLNGEYASKIGADAYGKDAMSAVRYAESFYK